MRRPRLPALINGKGAIQANARLWLTATDVW